MVTSQCLALFIFLVTLACWLIPRKINNSNNNSFVGLIAFTGISIILDLLSTYFAFSMTIDYEVKLVLRKMFLFSLVITFFFECSCIVEEALTIKQKEKFNQYSIFAPIINTIVVSLPELNIEVVQNGLNKGLNIYGPAFNIAYVCAGVYLAIIVIVLLFFNKRINKWYRISYTTSVILWTISTLLKYVSDTTGVVSVSIALSLLVIFAIVNNPLNQYNYKYHCFKSNYMNSFLDKACQLKDAHFLIHIIIRDLNKTSEEADRTTALKKRLINIFNKYRDTTVFISEEDEISIVCSSIEDYDSYKNIINNEIEAFYNSEQNKFFKAVVLAIENIILFDYGEEVILTLATEKEKGIKKRGHNVLFEIDENEITAIKTEDKIKNDIMDAITEDRVEVFVQPIYSVKDNKFNSAEALCRIRKEDGDYLLPYQFIPTSEKCGLDIAIGCRMNEKVCEIFANPRTSKLFESIDINLSVAHCEELDMAQKMISIANEYNVDPIHLNYEITESGFINKMANIENNIKKLTDYGFGFSLDDFGNHESNINYLAKFPVDYIKLDMHMIWAYFENDRARKIVQTIIKISHDNNLQVVAEGVETKEQYDELVSQGIDLIQGYYFYKPMPVENYLKIVENSK